MVCQKPQGHQNDSLELSKVAGIVQARSDLIARQVRKFSNDVIGWYCQRPGTRARDQREYVSPSNMVCHEGPQDRLRCGLSTQRA